MKRNYQSDFEILLAMFADISKEHRCDPMECNWVADFFTTSQQKMYRASNLGGVLTNCHVTEEGVHIVFGDHGLAPGTLRVHFTIMIPNSHYPDGIQTVTFKKILDVQLVDGVGDDITPMEIHLIRPYIKGEKGDPFTFADYTPAQLESLKGDKGDAFTFEDFTREQLDDLKRPMVVAAEASVKEFTEAAGRDIERAVGDADRATTEAVKATATANKTAGEVSAFLNEARTEEQERVAAEKSRAEAEQQRTVAEGERAKAESLRESAFNALRKDAVAATGSANAAAKSANDAVKSIDEKRVVTFDLADADLEAVEPNIVTDALRKTEQYLTEEEQVQVKKNLDISKLELFIDQWNEACGSYGTYNKNTGYFELNGLTDITYQQALSIMDAGRVIGNDANAYYSNVDKIRTNLPRIGGNTIVGTSAFISCHYIEVVNMKGLSIGVTTFFGTNKLHTIINLDSINTNVITQGGYRCPTLVNCISAIKGTYQNIDVQYLSKISLESIKSWIDNKAESVMDVTHVIKVHPDVYSKITDESNTEWNSLLALAATKNIQFATV